MPLAGGAASEGVARRRALPALGPGGCTVYADRPLVCCLFGATSGVMDLACPNGSDPADTGDAQAADGALRLCRAAGATRPVCRGSIAQRARRNRFEIRTKS